MNGESEPRRQRELRVVIAGLPYSENAGDRVIADCVDWIIRRSLGDVEVTWIDLAGRRTPNHQVVARRATALRLLPRLPPRLRQLVVSTAIRPILRRATPLWKSAVRSADLVVIGGGQLFSDVDLNFPLKVRELARIVRLLDNPIVIGSVGVSRNWTPTGKRMFRTLGECDLRFVGVRDSESLRNWTFQFAEGPTPELVPDPGLLSSRAYDLPVSEASTTIGIGVTSFSVLSMHANDPIAGAGAHSSEVNLEAFYLALARSLLKRGWQIRLFSNGAAEDQAIADRLVRDPLLAAYVADGRVQVAARPDSGRRLAEIIGGCGAIVSHRLHASIVAHSLGRPSIGLAWDRKVRSFFESTQRTRYFVSTPAASADDIASLADQAIGHGLDTEAVKSLEQQCMDQWSWLLQTVVPKSETHWTDRPRSPSSSGNYRE